ncbi:uncharacterized protein LOC107793740 isoform X2 [Nicotiana tabacum]|uniref:Uncharacterized protein LOC107793740 isoform X2 n=1 Tax=Nicotiana tabacum TaxID=4097 RepID=A0AC58UR16_TOBAC
MVKFSTWVSHPRFDGIAFVQTDFLTLVDCCIVQAGLTCFIRNRKANCFKGEVRVLYPGLIAELNQPAEKFMETLFVHLLASGRPNAYRLPVDMNPSKFQKSEMGATSKNVHHAYIQPGALARGRGHNFGSLGSVKTSIGKRTLIVENKNHNSTAFEQNKLAHINNLVPPGFVSMEMMLPSLKTLKRYKKQEQL